MRRKLSSHQTLFMKFILPGLWIPGFGMVTLITLNNSPAGPAFKVMFLLMWIAGSVFICWTNVSLKEVSVDQRFLYVSNYLTEIEIPLSEIYDVTENLWTNIHPITIHLTYPSAFGNTIVFMPKTRFLTFSSHPVVAELKRLARSHR